MRRPRIPGALRKSNKQEIYVSVDIEADGPIPGPNSMLSFGAAAFKTDGTMVDTFTANLETLPNAMGDHKTMEWWKTQEQAWKACRQNQQDPETAIANFVEWVEKLPGKPVFVGYPVAYDFMFVYWYMMKFVGRSPFSHSGLDMKTYAFSILKKGYRKSTKRFMPKSWFPKSRHTHVALDDAIERGQLFCNMLKANCCCGT
jgi:hypothetical protein